MKIQSVTELSLEQPYIISKTPFRGCVHRVCVFLETEAGSVMQGSQREKIFRNLNGIIANEQLV